jgi:hypothetical protein
MTLNVSSAIQFNNNRGYDAHATKLIQSHVQSFTHGVFDQTTVTAIYNWQKSPNRNPSPEADGKLGPCSLGLMISEMDQLGQINGAAILRKYPYSLPPTSGAAQTGDVDPVLSYNVNKYVSNLHLRADPDNPSRWLMKGRFEVKIKLNPKLADPLRYEYRQYIRGNSFTQRGYWNPESTIWTPRDGELQKSANEFFEIPKGKSSTKGLTQFWKEDGQIMSDGTNQHFGHRSAKPVTREGILDAYLVKNEMNQKGYDYELQDTYGLGGDYERGLRVMIELHYRGDIVKDGTQVIASQGWAFRQDMAINF